MGLPVKLPFDATTAVGISQNFRVSAKIRRFFSGLKYVPKQTVAATASHQGYLHRRTSCFAKTSEL